MNSTKEGFPILFKKDPSICGGKLLGDPYGPYGIRDITGNRVIDTLYYEFVNIEDIDPTIEIELKYATSDNVSGVAQYPQNMKAQLLRGVALMLKKSQQHLKDVMGEEYSLRVYDAGRPQEVQEDMYEWCLANGKPKLFANPIKGSIHTFGCAVDVTITKNGIPIDMGSVFDDPNIIAMPKYESILFGEGKLNKECIENRELLRRVMEFSGFSNIDIEWWHFETPDDDNDFGRRERIRKDLRRLRKSDFNI